jgi:dTDP-4-amino-4,6-dideoxygalactose transaminase
MSFEEPCFRWPIISEDTIREVVEQLRSGKISVDWELTESFESELASYFGVAHALLTTNGTSAAFSAFHALGLGAGDEVIVPAYTHPSVALPARLLGCRVVFADLEEGSLNPSLSAVEASLGSASRAVVVSHLYGNPVAGQNYRALCDRYGLYLVEDVSHAPGATVRGQRVGSFGDISYMSMQASKIVSGGEGGVLLARSPEHYARAVQLGHPKRAARLPEACRRVAADWLGHKFRLAPLLVIVARGAFRALDATNSARRAGAQALRIALCGLPGLEWPTEVTGAQRVFWENEFFLADGAGDRDDVLAALRELNTPVAPPKMDFLPALASFADAPPRSYPMAQRNPGRTLVLPAFTGDPEPVISRIATAFERAWPRRSGQHPVRVPAIVNAFPEPPIIIGGCGRSGTTLLLAILGSHPRILTVAEETQAFCPTAYGSAPDGTAVLLDRDQLFAARAARLNRNHPPDWARLERCLQRYHRSEAHVRFCEKTPKNVLFFWAILRSLGRRVRLIHMVRDGRDVVTSVHPGRSDWHVPPAQWVSEVQAGLELVDHPQVLTVRYEDLVLRLESTAERIFRFLDEPRPATLTDWHDRTTIRTHDSWGCSVRPLYDDGIGRWRRADLTARVRELLAVPGAADCLVRLGYALG